MIKVFKCPYWDECFKEVEIIFADNKPYATKKFPIGCPHPFLELNGEVLCGLTVPDNKAYVEVIKRIKKHKKSLKERLKSWLK